MKLPAYVPTRGMENARVHFSRMPRNLAWVAAAVFLKHLFEGKGGAELWGPALYSLLGFGLWNRTPARWRLPLVLPLLVVSLHALITQWTTLSPEFARWPLRLAIAPLVALAAVFHNSRLPAAVAGSLAIFILLPAGHVGWMPGIHAPGWLTPGGTPLEWIAQGTAVIYLILESCTRDDRRGIFLPNWVIVASFFGVSSSALTWYFLTNHVATGTAQRVGPGPGAELVYRLLGGLVVVGLLRGVRESRIQALLIQRLHLRLDRQLKRNQQNLVYLKEAREKAQQASKAKSEFLANMSHEIRNPLNVVVGMTRLLGETSSAQARKRQLATLTHASEQLLALVSNILDLSKIEAGAVAREPEVFSPKTLLGTLKNMFGPQATQKGIALRIKAAPSLPRWIETDLLHLKQVCINLVGNALRFTSEGYVEVRFSFQNAKLRVEVKDTGPGMSEADRRRLFEAYAQGANQTESTRATGTGLGLAISRKLVGLMGGTIQVESELGKGSCFWFEIPVLGAVAPKRQSEKRSRRSLTILLVDDDPFNREVAESTLRSLGWKPITCNHAEQALAYLANPRRPIHAALIDRRMPGMDGLTLARKIREMGLKLPLICVTGSATQEEAQETLLAGMNEVVVKPYSKEKLQRAILKVTQATVDAEATPQPASERLWGIFLTTMASGLKELEQGIQSDNTEAVSAAAHRLRSACAFLGLTGLEAICTQLETFPARDPGRELEALKQEYANLISEGGIKRTQVAA